MDHLDAQTCPEPGVRAPEAIRIRNQRGARSLSPTCNRVSPHKGRDAVDNAAATRGVLTKEFDSANRKIQLCCGKQMLFHKNEVTLI